MVAKLKLRCDLEVWPLTEPFGISSEVTDMAEAVVVTLEQDGAVGRGEANGVYFRGETGAVMVAQILAVQAQVEAGLDRDALQTLLAPGGARNAIDCALWDLEAKQTGVSAAVRAGLPLGPFSTVATVGLDAPEAMARKARALGFAATLKVKLGADRPLDHLSAVRAARPDARLIVDANQAWTLDQLAALWPAMQALGVEMIEQPLPVGQDAGLSQADCGITLCADETCHTRADLPGVRGAYGMINIKLDKTGGLTEAVALARAARAQGFELMVGNMIGTSLAMAPASLLASQCRYVDLDGPLLLARDREPAMVYDGDRVSPPDRALWG